MTEKDEKPTSKHSESTQWWQQEKVKLAKGDVLRFLHENKERLEKSIASIHERSLAYRATNVLFSLFSNIAGLFDRLKDFIVVTFLKLPAPQGLKDYLHSLLNVINFKGIVDFLTAKFYSFKQAPQNVRAVHMMDDIIAFAKRDGLDIKKHFPDIAKKFQKRKNQLLQHNFFMEFSKSGLDFHLIALFILFYLIVRCGISFLSI
jgi:hypothetical protein